MARNKVSADIRLQPTTIRLEPDVRAFYQREAKKRGIPISDLYRQLLTQGVLSETTTEIFQRCEDMVARVQGASDGGGGTREFVFPDEVLLSIFTTEFLIRAIVEARNIQEVNAAHDKAVIKLSKFKKQREL